MKYLLIVLLAIGLNALAGNAFTAKQVKCHVCKATVQEMEDAIAKEDPKRRANINGFRLDAQGNSVSKTVPLIKSEMYLTELMEEICEKMEDYAKATHKKSGRFTLIKMVIDGKMNPETSSVDFVQDGDLNKSLKHYCLEVLEDQEDIFMNAFKAEEVGNDLDIKICSAEANYCDDAPVEDDYAFDDYKEEL